MDIKDESLKLHEKLRGKLEIVARADVSNRAALSVAYTPGVAAPCLEIAEDKSKVYKYTRKWNMVAVVSDGSAVLGLGNIGAEASLPVMEGKSVLFKQFGNVDAIPIIIQSQDVDEIVNVVKNISPSFGGINLEDISAPRCFEIESKLKEILDIPVFHDDQHGTAIVVLAALLNSLKIVNKKLQDIKVVINGPGAAGNAICKLLLNAGVKDIILCDRKGMLYNGRQDMDWAKQELAKLTNLTKQQGSLSKAVIDCDVFIGVSSAKALSKDMVKTMKKDAIIFALANPEPEILPEQAKEAGARVIGTGRSDFANQINNVLVFPGIFRGAFDAGAMKITEDMKIAAAYAIADLVSKDELNEEFIIPYAFDKRVCEAVSNAVKKVAIQQDLCRKQ